MERMDGNKERFQNRRRDCRLKRETRIGKKTKHETMPRLGKIVAKKGTSRKSLETLRKQRECCNSH